MKDDSRNSLGVSPRFTVATDMFAPRERFDGWRDLFSPSVDLAYDRRRGDFSAKAEMSRLGPGFLAQTTGPGLRSARGKSTLARSAIDALSVILPLEHQRVTAGSDRQIAPGSVYFLDYTQAYVTESARPSQVRHITLPRVLLQQHLPGVEDLHGAVLAPNDPRARLARNWFHYFWHHAPAQRPSDGAPLAQASAGFLAACFALDARTRSENKKAIDLAQALLVKAFIETNLRRGDLGPAAILHYCGLSRSRLYEVLAQDGGVSRYIQERRLHRAARDLANSNSGRRTIQEIAESLGFVSPPHFSRAFKAAFGMGPREFKNLAEPTGHKPIAVPVVGAVGQFLGSAMQVLR